MEMIFPLVEHNREEGKLFYCSSMKGTNVQTLGAVCGTAAWKMGSPRPLAAAYAVLVGRASFSLDVYTRNG